MRPDLETNYIGIQQPVAPVYGLPAARIVLVEMRSTEEDLLPPDPDRQGAIFPEICPLGTVKPDAQQGGIGARVKDQVVFQRTLRALVEQVRMGVKLAVQHLAVIRNGATPCGRILPQEVVGRVWQLVPALAARGRGRGLKAHLQLP